MRSAPTPDSTAAAVEIVLTPAGHLRIESAPAGGPGRSPLPETSARRIASAFEEGAAEGLLHLAASEAPAALPAAFSYWREFAGRFLTTLCLVPETAGAEIGPLPAPEGSELDRLCQSAPPMLGSEYLNAGVLAALWEALDRRARAEITAGRGGLSAWLKDRAPLWHRVGRVCFHLAENKRDPLRPFAFLATYGAKNKAVLEKLLTPVQRAAEKSALVRELVDSGEVFHPLAWTAHERLTTQPPCCYIIIVSGRLARMFVLAALAFSWAVPLCAVAAPAPDHACCDEHDKSAPAHSHGLAACCQISEALPTAPAAAPIPASQPVLNLAVVTLPRFVPCGSRSVSASDAVVPQASPGVCSGLSPPAAQA
ncbi:MAG: hypothetical protein KGJ84_12440 [Elusimicrobia bacterium]|nr:hypothetical protein [Elusimicrobiota bacterium]